MVVVKGSENERVDVKVSNAKPIYKSKTIVFNTTALFIGLSLIFKGLADGNSNMIAQGLTTIFMALVNWILRIVTKQPVKFRR